MSMEQYSEQIRQMRDAAQRAYAIRLQSGDGGNLSVRLNEQQLILIKSSGCSFAEIDSSTVVAVDYSGAVAEGDGIPSRELLTHLAIYRSRPEVHAIFHSHSPWAVSAAQQNTVLPPVSLPLELKLGTVPILDVGEHHANEEMAASVSAFLETHKTITAFIQRRHGLFCMAKNIIQAEHDAELVEEASQIACIIRMMQEADQRG